ncbi:MULTISPECIES: HNH endonuclease family protein [Nonomuraea]|uniref:HNH endonuclease family protein n=1 Tax=Nonomuraea ferruginea TaxID=46174 RepID=A0ABT4TAK5_9ACTN|nr:HNH endonuclease family protein [Nonomuraea ferruginea]MDA0646566.1 HNH endonuclease family protein [Nonomuraea ferruginea]
MSLKDAVAIFAGAVIVVALANSTDTTAPATAASPLGNTSGTLPGLAPITSRQDKDRARAIIARLKVKGRGPSTGYHRGRYGENWADTATGVPYARNGCRTRDDLLARDGRNVRYREGSTCEVIAMDLDDPYTGQRIGWSKRDAGAVQVDHVVPLAYAWRMGASRWAGGKRVDFANDPLNLLPVKGAANEQKDASGPASWLPPQRRVRCAYVTRFAQVAVKYAVPVTRADKKAMLAQCR